MLPSRIERASKLPPKGAKRSGRWKSQRHRDFVRGFNCCVPECMGRPIEVAHIRMGTDGGMGKKPSDFYTISLCSKHHSEQHQIGEASFEIRYDISMRELAEEFSKASPLATEIRERKQNDQND